MDLESFLTNMMSKKEKMKILLKDNWLGIQVSTGDPVLEAQDTIKSTILDFLLPWIQQ